MDQHGQLFLSGTKIRNFTSCYKDPAFLDFFYSRLKPVSSSTSIDPAESDRLKRDEYTFISLCGLERNYIRSQDTPIVFRELIEQQGRWLLRYAGTLVHPFSPDSLKVDTRGYLYHPSPLPTRPTRQRQSIANPSNPYGAYSLLRSELVLSKFSKGLDIAEDGQGEYHWLKQKYNIGKLEEEEVTRGRGYPE